MCHYGCLQYKLSRGVACCKTWGGQPAESSGRWILARGLLSTLGEEWKEELVGDFSISADGYFGTIGKR